MSSVEAIRRIATNPKLREEARTLLPVLESTARAVQLSEEHDAAILEVLVRNAPPFGVQAKSGAEWAALFEVYIDALESYPVEAVQDAFARWNRAELYPAEPQRQAFFPKPAELVTLAERFMVEVRTAAYRARRALAYVEDKGLEWTPERKRAEREKMIALGLLTADGKPNFVIGGKTLADAPKLAGTQHEAAQRIRQMAAADEVGDVI